MTQGSRSFVASTLGWMLHPFQGCRFARSGHPEGMAIIQPGVGQSDWPTLGNRPAKRSTLKGLDHLSVDLAPPVGVKCSNAFSVVFSSGPSTQGSRSFVASTQGWMLHPLQGCRFARSGHPEAIIPPAPDILKGWQSSSPGLANSIGLPWVTVPQNDQP